MSGGLFHFKWRAVWVCCGMRWKRTRSVTKWGLTVVAVFFAILAPLTLRLRGTWFRDKGTPQVAMGMLSGCITVTVFRDRTPATGWPLAFSWWRGPLNWRWWPYFGVLPTAYQAAVPLWMLAVIP